MNEDKEYIDNLDDNAADDIMDGDEIKEEEQTKSVFKNKNFVLLLQGRFTSDIASTFYSFALSFYILVITNNNALIQGIYLASTGLVFVLVSLVGGVLADRWNKVKIIFGSDFIKGGSILLSLIPLYLFIRNGNNVGQIVVLFSIGVINSIIQAIFSPATNAIVPEIVERNQLQQANSFGQGLSSFVSILGIVLAGIFYALLPITVLFIIVGSLYVVSGITELFIKVPYEHENDQNLTMKDVMHDLSDGFKFVFSSKALLTVMFAVLFINFFFVPIDSNFFPFFIETEVTGSNYMFNSFLKPELWQSIASVLFCITSLITAIVLGSKKQKEHYNKAIKLWLLPLGMIFLIFSIIYGLFIEKSINVVLISLCVAMAVSGVSVIAFNISTTVVLQRDVPMDKHAKVSSVVNIGTQGLSPIAALLGGIVLEFAGSLTLLIACSAGMFLVITILACSKKVNEL